ncbi:MAG: TetR/AcrR family transcriptional regulator [Candidatus Cloacimonetes bacterium]|nr:TetR/AcrR family transcriptional regulator [Candidatus Cloacimonadota bacterium]
METTQIDKKERIAQAALEVFKKYGYHKTSIADIAKEAGLGKGTIYYYFDSKEDIYVEILGNQAETTFRRLEEQLRQEKDVREKLRLLFIKPVKLLSESAPLLMDVFSGECDIFQQKIMAFKQRYHDRLLLTFQQLIESGQSQGVIRAELDAALVTEVLHRWLHFWMHDSGCKRTDFDLSPESIARFVTDYELIVDLLLHGMLIGEVR